MTLLPGARDFTLVDGDPVPPNLLNNLQDMFVGDKRTAFSPIRFASGWISTVALPTLVANPQGGGMVIPVWHFPGNGTYRTGLSYQVGELVSDFQFDVFGDGVVDWTIDLKHDSDLTAAPTTAITIASGSVNNSPASWTRYTMSVIGSVNPTILQVGYLSLEVFVSGGGVNLYLGNTFMGMSR